MLGTEIRQVNTSMDNSTVYGYNEDPLTYSNVDFVNYYPSFTIGIPTSISGGPSFASSTNRFVSFYGNAVYSYKKRYSISASGRKDGSNIFGANSNDKWKPLWSVGAGWKISDEPFYKYSGIPLLRLRTTYGYSGNVDLSKTASAVAIYYSGNPPTNLPYTRIRSLNNPDLRWEKSGMFNIALDFALNNNRISGSIDYYVKKGTDLYGRTSYDYTTWGFSPNIVKNAASILGKGIDLVLNSKNVDKTFTWNSSLLFNYNTDKTTKYDDDEAKNSNAIIGSGQGIIPEIGRPLYAIAAYKWEGLDNSGNPQGLVNGQKSTDYEAIFNEGTLKGTNGNIVFVGPSSPTIFGSLVNSFSWKGFSISVNIAYKFGYYFQKSTIAYTALVNSGTGHKDYARRWQNPGDELKTNVPAFIYPNNGNRDNFYQSSEVNILRADHVRLQYINLSYSLLKERKNNVPFNDLQLYLNAANLGILWRSNKENLDPEYPSVLKPERSITLGLRVNF